MTVRLLTLAGLCCLVVACGKAPSAGSGSLNDPCLSNADCKAPFICVADKTAATGALHCDLDKAAACDKDKQRCNGMDIETCSGDAGDGVHGNKWTVAKDADHCTTACIWNSGNQTASCAPQVCTPSTATKSVARCAPTSDGSDPTTIQECNGTGSAWVDAQVCPTTCVEDSTAQTAECSTPVCEPYSYRCKDGDASVHQRCNARGTAWTDVACPADGDTPTTCVSGECLPVVCQTGEQRCNGNVAEVCNPSRTAFIAQQVCSNGCLFDETSGTASCPAQVCSPYATRCKPATATGTPPVSADVMQQCNSYGTAWVDQTPPAGQRCVNGEYVAKVCSYSKTGSTVTADGRCDGAVREQCNPNETGWDAVELCQFGCQVDGNGTPSCIAPTCALGEMTCGGTDGSALETCGQARTSWDFVQYCPGGCQKDASTTPATASCQPTFCQPLATGCGTDPATAVQYVKICEGNGSKYDRIEDCAQSCNGGYCTMSDARCHPGDVRCTGPEVEQCELLSNGATEWRFSERCLGQCLSGSCSPGGSAGCVGGASATKLCGAPDRQVINLHPLLADPTNEVVPCDGYSRVLVYTDPIVGADGAPVPDGTMVTFAHDYPAGAPDDLLGSADADPTLPGLQRPTLHGRAIVVLNAPASCAAPRTVTVTASVGGRATGHAGVAFAAPSATAGQKDIYVAEDFSTSDHDDRSNTDAQWNTRLGALVGQTTYNFGSGKDGDYDATGTTPHDLAAEGYARSWNVLRIASNELTVDNVMPSVAPGDEVLLTQVWSTNPSNIGRYEFHRVKAVASGRIVLDAPVQNVYGNGGANDDFTDDRTIVQRVPQFHDVTVEAGARIAAVGPTLAPLQSNPALRGALAGGTGIVAFRATGTVHLLGVISAENAGLPLGVAVQPPVGPNINGFTLGRSGAGSAGGGVVFTAAKTVSFKDGDAFAGPEAAFAAGSSAGTAGSAGAIIVQSAVLELGPQPRFLAGTNYGRARLEFVVTDVDPTANPAPNPFPILASYRSYGQTGPFTARSTVAYDELAAAGVGGNALSIFNATLEGAIGGSASTTVVAPMPSVVGLQGPLSSLSVSASADGGASFAPANLGKVSFNVSTGTAPPPFVGQQFEWSANLINVDDQPVYLRGLEFKVHLK